MNRNSTNLTRKNPSKPTRHKPPVVIWSNLAYAADDQSSVASNGSQLDSEPCGRRRGLLSADFIIGEEELRLREELGKEIEKELERELMDGIMALVRRLSDLKAKQFVRALGDPRRLLCDDNDDDDDDMTGERMSTCGEKRDEKKWGRKSDGRERKGDVKRASDGRGDLGYVCSDAESRTSGLKHGRRRERCSDRRLYN